MAVAWGVSAFAVSGAEVWIYRPNVSIADLSVDNSAKTKTLAQDPKIVATDYSEKLVIQGVRWQDTQLVVQNIHGRISVGRLAAEKSVTVLGRTQPIKMSLQKAEISLTGRRPLQIALPEKIAVRAERSANGARFTIDVEKFRAAIAASVDQVLAPGSFDQLFALNVSTEGADMARQIFSSYIQNEKENLLKQARESLKKSFEASHLDSIFLLSQIQVPVAAQGDWTLQSFRTPSGVVWSLREESKATVYQVPNVPAGVNNLVSIVLPTPQVESLTAAALSPIAQLDEAISEAVAGMVEYQRASGELLSIVTTGERAPRARAWKRLEKDGRTHHYLNVLFTVHSKDVVLGAVGALLEVGGQAVPRVLDLFLVDGKDNRAWGKEQPGLKALLVRALAKTLLQSEIDAATARVSNTTGLQALGMRALGTGDARGEGQGDWASALCMDFVKN